MREYNNNKVILIALNKKLQMCQNILTEEPCLDTDGSRMKNPLVTNCSFADFTRLGKL